ncbi:MAG TPA: RDD family protein [Acidimicrobiales bacterium]|nr:RDD family protein [Acidimicrobiales bacterium]
MVPTANLLTPEAVALDIPTASAGWRIAARAIDVVASLVGFYIIVLIGAGAGTAFGPNGGATLTLVLTLTGSFVLVALYPMLMETFCSGRTLGKLAVGLRVVRVDGGRISFGQATVRAAFGLVEVWATLGGLGTLFILLTRRDQRLGDMVAGTVVLRERRGRRELYPVALRPPPGCEQLVQTMDVGAMTASDYELVRQFLVRWQTFGPRRTDVATKLAGPLWQRFRHPLPPNMGPDYYLACLGAAYQFRHPPLVPRVAWAPPGSRPSGTSGYPPPRPPYPSGQYPSGQHPSGPTPLPAATASAGAIQEGGWSPPT